jgi:hypothetical protein
MIFQEKKTTEGYVYNVEDIFGTVSIDSDVKLDGDTLDGIVMVLLRQNISAEEILGEVKHNGGVVRYRFKKRPLWEDEKICKNTPTSTSKQESVPIHTHRSILGRIIRLVQRFAEAFREAWKKTKTTL